MKRKVGRPIKQNAETYIQGIFNLNETTNKNLIELANINNFSKTGVVRTAIDYLYYTMLDNKLPKDLEVIIEIMKENISDEKI